jgi:hypothetical protein
LKNKKNYEMYSGNKSKKKQPENNIESAASTIIKKNTREFTFK